MLNEINMIVINEMNSKMKLDSYINQIIEFKNIFNKDVILLYINIGNEFLNLYSDYEILKSFMPLSDSILCEYLLSNNIPKSEIDKFNDYIKCFIIKL
jgi:hypothetical protein